MKFCENASSVSHPDVRRQAVTYDETVFFRISFPCAQKREMEEIVKSRPNKKASQK